MDPTEAPPAEMQAANQHLYDELSTLSIRLFRLENAASGELKIQLSTFAIDGELPDYIALSYTWEPRFPLHVTQVNNGELSIGHNLWEALQTLLPLDGTFFWADQICINQQRTHELNHQVGFMHRIYNLAKTVLIWLGSANSGSDGAMQVISYLAAAICHSSSDQCNCDHVKEAENDEEEVEICRHHFEGTDGMFQNRSPVVMSIRLLFRRQYWSRVWVVQAIMFARNLFVKCGNWTITWAQLRWFYHWTTSAREQAWRGEELSRFPDNCYPPSSARSSKSNKTGDSMILGHRRHEIYSKSCTYATHSNPSLHLTGSMVSWVWFTHMKGLR